METKTTYKSIALILGFLLLLSFFSGNSARKDNTILEDRISSLESRLEKYQYALEEANSNIEDANSIIEEAQSYAWSSYNDMGDVLDNLSTVETVDEP